MKEKTKKTVSRKVGHRKVNLCSGYGLITSVNLACDEFFRRRGMDPNPDTPLWHKGVAQEPKLDFGLED